MAMEKVIHKLIFLKHNFINIDIGDKQKSK